MDFFYDYWTVFGVFFFVVVIVSYNLYSFRKKFRILSVVWYGQKYLDMEDEVLQVLEYYGKCTFNELVIKRQDFIDDQELFKKVMLALVKSKTVLQTFPEYQLSLDSDKPIRYEIPYYSLPEKEV
jgi:hypothetical protein